MSGYVIHSDWRVRAHSNLLHEGSAETLPTLTINALHYCATNTRVEVIDPSQLEAMIREVKRDSLANQEALPVQLAEEAFLDTEEPGLHDEKITRNTATINHSPRATSNEVKNWSVLAIILAFLSSLFTSWDAMDAIT